MKDTKPQVTRVAYRVKEAAEALGVCPAKIYNLLAAGTLQSISVDGARRIPVKSIDQYANSQLTD